MGLLMSLALPSAPQSFDDQLRLCQRGLWEALIKDQNPAGPLAALASAMPSPPKPMHIEMFRQSVESAYKIAIVQEGPDESPHGPRLVRQAFQRAINHLSSRERPSFDPEKVLEIYLKKGHSRPQERGSPESLKADYELVLRGYNEPSLTHEDYQRIRDTLKRLGSVKIFSQTEPSGPSGVPARPGKAGGGEAIDQRIASAKSLPGAQPRPLSIDKTDVPVPGNSGDPIGLELQIERLSAQAEMRHERMELLCARFGVGSAVCQEAEREVRANNAHRAALRLASYCGAHPTDCVLQTCEVGSSVCSAVQSLKALHNDGLSLLGAVAVGADALTLPLGPLGQGAKTLGKKALRITLKASAKAEAADFGVSMLKKLGVNLSRHEGLVRQLEEACQKFSKLYAKGYHDATHQCGPESVAGVFLKTGMQDFIKEHSDDLAKLSPAAREDLLVKAGYGGLLLHDAEVSILRKVGDDFVLITGKDPSKGQFQRLSPDFVQKLGEPLHALDNGDLVFPKLPGSRSSLDTTMRTLNRYLPEAKNDPFIQLGACATAFGPHEVAFCDKLVNGKGGLKEQIRRLYPDDADLIIKLAQEQGKQGAAADVTNAFVRPPSRWLPANIALQDEFRNPMVTVAGSWGFMNFVLKTDPNVLKYFQRLEWGPEKQNMIRNAILNERISRKIAPWLQAKAQALGKPLSTLTPAEKALTAAEEAEMLRFAEESAKKLDNYVIDRSFWKSVEKDFAAMVDRVAHLRL
ncbi:MAG: hypothetical protein HY549_07755 [Elusimicrobia bacterium]|nr:hypothetical protein [Elusimicrobiota bacterium]